MLSRRSLITGLGASLIAAPAIVRAASLMPVRGLLLEHENLTATQIMPRFGVYVVCATRWQGFDWNVTADNPQVIHRRIPRIDGIPLQRGARILLKA